MDIIDDGFDITHFEPAEGPGRGFSLIETSVAMVIVTVAITALCDLLSVGTTSNVAGNEMTTAVNLANTVHEVAMGLPYADAGKAAVGPYHDVWDLNGLTASPPLDAGLQPIADYPNWEQRVTVQTVDANGLTTLLRNDRSAPAARLTVEVCHENHFVYAGSWLVVADHK